MGGVENTNESTRGVWLIGLLADRARLEALRALTHFVNGSVTDFAIHAGVCVELLVKARLASESIAFLAPRNNWFASALLLTRASDEDLRRARTVGAEEGLERLVLLDPTIAKVVVDRAKSLLQERNQAVHFFVEFKPSDSLRHSAASLAKVVTSLRGPLGETDAEYWGELEELVVELLAEDLDHVRVAVKSRFELARARVRALGSEALAQLQELARAARGDLIGPESLPFDCPVCESVGRVDGNLVDEGEPDVDGGPDGVNVYWAYDFRLYIHFFGCPVCLLELDGEDELREAGLPPSVAHEDVDPADLYEPDEDLYRDR